MPKEVKELKSIGIIVQNGKEFRLDELPKAEQKRLAHNWNVEAMKVAGYVPTAQTAN